MSADPETLTQKTGHLAWCAMTALFSARAEGKIISASQEDLFLTRWLATALKQHRFSRDVAPDIEWLLREGRTLGTRARLLHKLDYLWRSCTGELKAQNDLFRLTYAFETAKEMQWSYVLLNDREWSGRRKAAVNGMINSISVSRSSLDTAFDDNGRQFQPVTVQITGNVEGLNRLFERCAWRADNCTENNTPHQFLLIASHIENPSATG